HRAGRALPPRARALAAAQARDHAGGAGERAARRRPHARPRRGAAGRRAPHRRHPSRARLLMDPDPSLADFSAAVTRADADIPLARAALLIAAAEQPGLEVDKPLARLDDLAEAPVSRSDGHDELRRLHRLREFLFEEQGFAGDRGDYFDPRNSYLNHVLDRRLDKDVVAG